MVGEGGFDRIHRGRLGIWMENAFLAALAFEVVAFGMVMGCFVRYHDG